MNNQQINAAIAESIGWDFDPVEAHEWGSRGRWVKPPSGELVFRHSIPDYCNDLNTMHEAEKVLDMHQQYDYGEALARMRIGAEFDDPEGFSPNGWGYYSPITATAAQRAEAYLKTIGKWQQETSREDGTK